MPKGEDVTLNGKQALAFCRVRGCDADGDVSRTRRQRQVIDSMVTRVIDSSISEINEYIDILLPYVETGYSETQIISLGLKAITGGWALYDRTQISVPDEEDRIPGDANMWIWVIDYQKAARKLQKELYGESNIVLSDDRVSIIDSYR
jgi:anionic cell wall polymer biosynthesis LytR-Cps2A-Psr (LCP) family protein